MTTELTSWKDGPAKQAIVDFVTSATQDGPRFIPAADRIATFDNDVDIEMLTCARFALLVNHDRPSR